MPRHSTRAVPLTDLVLPDARSGEPVDLAALPGTTVLTAIRHRY